MFIIFAFWNCFWLHHWKFLGCYSHDSAVAWPRGHLTIHLVLWNLKLIYIWILLIRTDHGLCFCKAILPSFAFLIAICFDYLRTKSNSYTSPLSHYWATSPSAHILACFHPSSTIFDHASPYVHILFVCKSLFYL